jgi:hypothetical protein
MRKLLTLWNIVGLIVFLLGGLFYWQTGGGRPPTALPLPAEEVAKNALVLVLYRPNPPQGFLKETQTLDLGPGETPGAKALLAWSQAVSAPKPLALFLEGKRLIVDLPQDFALGLDAGLEVFRLYSLAYTLLSTFPQAEEVRFLVEGKPGPGLAHLDLTKPIRLP